MKKSFAVFVLLFLLAAGLAALGRQEPEEEKLQTVQVSGRLRLVGSGPQTMLVISAEEREWYIDSQEQKKLTHLQQQIITVEGREYYRDIVFANGLNAGRQYFLKDVKLIEPKR